MLIFTKNFFLFLSWILLVFSILHRHHQALIGIGVLFLLLNHLEACASPKLPINFFKHVLAIFIPISLLWLLYHSAPNAWWNNDDPQILQAVISNGMLPHFYDPTVWQQLQPANFTPWLPFSYGIDWHLFGFQPRGFYWHHLFSFSLVIILAYWLLSSYFSALVVSMVLSIVVASLPSSGVVQLLMNRHYLEGLGFAILAYGCYWRAVQRGQLSWAIVGGLFYLLATTAKEIYVPLVVILLWLSVRTLKQRWQMLIPFLLVAGIYVIWRFYMLGLARVISGYGSEVIVKSLEWQGVINLPLKIAELMVWRDSWQLVVLAAVFSIYLLILIRSGWSSRLSLVGWFLVVSLPLVPVLSIFDPRYLFFPFFMIGIIIAIVFQYLSVFRPLVVLLGFLLLVSGLKSVETSYLWGSTYHVKRHAIEGQFILTGSDANAILINPMQIYPYQESFYWLRANVLKLPPGPKVCGSSCFCDLFERSIYTYRYPDDSVTLVPLSQRGQYAAECDFTAALTVQLSYERDAVEWQLGPYKSGKYFIAIGTNSGFYPVPREGKLYQPLWQQVMKFAIKYDSPEGWQSYSPTLLFDPRKTDSQGVAHFHWYRHSP
jgi:hypothetical protein